MLSVLTVKHSNYHCLMWSCWPRHSLTSDHLSKECGTQHNSIRFRRARQVFKLLEAYYDGISAMPSIGGRGGQYVPCSWTHSPQPRLQCRTVNMMSCKQGRGLRKKGLAQYLKGEVSHLLRTQSDRLSRDSNCWVRALSQGGHEQLSKLACIPYSHDHLGRAVELYLRIAHRFSIITNRHGCDLKNMEAVRNYQIL
jgi:hypothetical protein